MDPCKKASLTFYQGRKDIFLMNSIFPLVEEIRIFTSSYTTINVFFEVIRYISISQHPPY